MQSMYGVSMLDARRGHVDCRCLVRQMSGWMTLSQWGLCDMDVERALAVFLMFWLCSVAVGSPAVAGTDIAADNTVTAMQSACACLP